MSADLLWQVVRNNHAFLLKKRTVPRPFSTEPGNLLNLEGKRLNGLVNKKVVAIDAPRTSKYRGVQMRIKSKRANRRVKNGCSTLMLTKQPGRRTLRAVKSALKANKSNLTGPAMRRASAILRAQGSQKNKKEKRQGGTKK